MNKLAQLEAEIMSLPDGDRAELASYILRSLPPFFEDDDGGISEALLRREEMEKNPDCIITLEQLQKAVGR